MSADNTILIVRFSNKKWRMIEVGNAEDIYWDWEVENNYSPKINPRSLYEFLKDAKVFKSKHLAYDEAEKYYKDHYVEYGIRPMDVEYNWEELIDLAFEKVSQEISYLNNQYKGNNKDYFVEILMNTRDELEKKINGRKK